MESQSQNSSNMPDPWYSNMLIRGLTKVEAALVDDSTVTFSMHFTDGAVHQITMVIYMDEGSYQLLVIDEREVLENV